MKAGSEAAFQQQIEQLAAFYGWELRFHSPDNLPVQTRSGRTRKQHVEPGFPDLVLCRPPELIVVELKTEKGRVRPEQTRWLEALDACGLETWLVRPSGFDALHRRLARGRTMTQPLYRAEEVQ